MIQGSIPAATISSTQAPRWVEGVCCPNNIFLGSARTHHPCRTNFDSSHLPEHCGWPSTVATVFTIGDGFCQQDSASCYTAKKVKECFQEHDMEFTLSPLLPDSPSMNPIENLFVIWVEETVSSNITSTAQFTELRGLLWQSRCQISRNTYQHLVESLPG